MQGIKNKFKHRSCEKKFLHTETQEQIKAISQPKRWKFPKKDIPFFDAEKLKLNQR